MHDLHALFTYKYFPKSEIFSFVYREVVYAGKPKTKSHFTGASAPKNRHICGNNSKYSNNWTREALTYFNLKGCSSKEVNSWAEVLDMNSITIPLTRSCPIEAWKEKSVVLRRHKNSEGKVSLWIKICWDESNIYWFLCDLEGISSPSPARDYLIKICTPFNEQALPSKLFSSHIQNSLLPLWCFKGVLSHQTEQQLGESSRMRNTREQKSFIQQWLSHNILWIFWGCCVKCLLHISFNLTMNKTLHATYQKQSTTNMNSMMCVEHQFQLSQMT